MLASETTDISGKIIEAHQRSSMWLYEANVASEQGNTQKEQKCLDKAQYWLDKLNKLEGYS